MMDRWWFVGGSLNVNTDTGNWPCPRVLGVIAGFVADAWIRRSGVLACSALNGRVTNGGNPEV